MIRTTCAGEGGLGCRIGYGRRDGLLGVKLLLLLLRLRNRGTDDTLVLRLDDNGCSVGDCGSLMIWLLQLLLLLSTGGASG